MPPARLLLSPACSPQGVKWLTKERQNAARAARAQITLLRPMVLRIATSPDNLANTWQSIMLACMMSVVWNQNQDHT